MNDNVEMVLTALTGHDVPGGCLDCGAVQRLVREGRGVFVVVIAHDDTCPAYQAIVRERSS